MSGAGFLTYGAYQFRKLQFVMTRALPGFLACMALLLFACSPEVPTAGPATAVPQVRDESTSVPHPDTSSPAGSPQSPQVIAEASATTSAPTITPVAAVPSPTRPPATATPPVAPQPAQTIAPTELPSPQGDADATVILALAVAESSAELPVYSRDDWRHWTDEDGDCQDTRNEVLLAENLVDATYRSDRRCRVASGQWFAPYSSTVVTVPSDLDIDHMVPLANAHKSGAWQWSPERKRLYANYLDDPSHLIAVTASANRSKGAKGPDEWKPPDGSYWCQYAVDWITVKFDWELTATPEEFVALDQMLATCDVPHQLGVVVTFERPNLPSFGGSTPLPTPANEPSARLYASCDEAEAAGETRVLGSQGSGRGFPKAMVPSARDGDGDGVVCER